ncbi:MAG: AAA family ATPase [Chromatiales bacterium]|nr:AAA family ATPase [Chromatiales bacterium]
MEMVLFSGIQASGKSTLFRQRFVDTHLRINLDMLRTRHRERLLVEACLRAKQPFVVENTNLTPVERARYLEPARAARFRIVGYRFQLDLETALQRNSQREGRHRVPDQAVRGAQRQWVPPTWAEGFDALFDVWSEAGDFRILEVAHAER